MTLPLRPGLVSILLVAALGCGGARKPATVKKAVTAAPGPPPPPPPAPTSTSTVTSTSAPAAPAAAEIPVWAGAPGEPFDVKQFLISGAPPANNAAPMYLAALAPICGDLGGASAAQLEAQIKELADVEKLAAGAVPMEQVENVLRAAAPAVQQVDAAQARPNCVFITQLSADTQLPHAAGARSLGRLAVLQLHAARAERDFDQAEAAIRRGLRMSRDVRPRGVIVCQVVSIANDGLLFSAIERLTLPDPNLTPQQCDRLLALFAEHEQQGLDRYEEGVQTDYIMARCTISDLQTGRLTLGQVQKLITGKDNSPGVLPLNYAAEIAACNRLFAAALSAAQSRSAPPDEFSSFRAEQARLRSEWETFRAKVDATAPAGRPALARQVPATQFYLWTTGAVPGRAATWRLAANLAGLQMLVAMRHYELAHQRPPSNLAEAAAETILKEVPTDPFSGEALRFAEVDGRPVAYSIGKDLKDDGGRVDWKLGTQPGDYCFSLPR